MRCRELRIGDELVDSDNKIHSVDHIYYEVLEEPVTVYNFQVEDFHTYHVGYTGVLVHNAGRSYKKPASGDRKKRSTDVPSRFKGERPFVGESGRDFAKRLLDADLGEENYPIGSNTEFSALQKNGDRGFVDPPKK